MNLPKWLERRYDILWESFRDSPFSFEKAAKVLKEKNDDSADQVNVILNELKKKGWLKVIPHKKDARKKIYTLISREKAISDLFSEVKQKESLTRSELESLLKRAADLIRTRVDYTFILVLLFYKRISDKWRMEYEKAYKEAIEDGLTPEEAEKEAKNAIHHDFDIPEEFLWDNIRKNPAKLTENFSKAMKVLAERNSEVRDIFENVDFIQFTRNRENEELLRQLVELFSARSLHDVSPDILGDAYEWILRYFAPQKAKEGEVYTPREVIKLMIEILDPKPGEKIYDPACGSGGMLIIGYKHVENEYGPLEANKLFLYGQEANYKTLALARMNFYIHDIRNIQLAYGDTLLSPKFKEGEKPQKFEIAITNPPWNQDGYGEDTLKKAEFYKERFPFGSPTKQSADWAWIQHLIYSIDDKKGRAGIVMDNGCLFRGGREKNIRKEFIEKGWIETVILLPEKLFYNTGAPGAIMIFRKNREGRMRDEEGGRGVNKHKILFINASKEYKQHPEVRKLNILSDENIKKIVDTYKNFKEIEGFSRVVDIEEIRENDYNLNVTLYVFPEEETEHIDVAKEWKELMEIEKEIDKIEEKIKGYLKELEYEV